ncbi:hypothetical protein AOQ84DRAFT_419495 [Glonium stellatum]|uniref:Uncharacterized protein n=1 Tax=Glonium stellatum TaxID=574774 RepID=A0A8E2F8J6_9PEZI|nr:hypothetical protein AOQ84DRAFT_419495 [Glonium stellatum]
MDSPSATPDSSAAKLSPAQEQARLRRERRNAKIQAGGASRLQAITSLNGGHSAPEPPPAVNIEPAPSQSPQPSSPTHHADPAEVDISQHYYTTQNQTRASTSRSQQPSPFAFNDTNTPPFPPPQDDNLNQDPMLAIMQQMLGTGSDPNIPSVPQMLGNLPPDLAQMLSGMQQPPESAQPASNSAYVWRVIHALFSLALALYITLTSSFTGSKLSRTHPEPSWDDEAATSSLAHFFYAFATFEIVLQTSRYFMERGQLPPSGFLGGIAQILPEPYAGYVRVVGRYSVIWQTVAADAMVVVFVLGAAAWWRGGAGS